MPEHLSHVLNEEKTRQALDFADDDEDPLHKTEAERTVLFETSTSLCTMFVVFIMTEKSQTAASWALGR